MPFETPWYMPPALERGEMGKRLKQYRRFVGQRCLDSKTRFLILLASACRNRNAEAAGRCAQSALEAGASEGEVAETILTATEE